MKKQFVVIGLGRFGSSVALTLEEADCEVLAVDINEERVNEIADHVTYSVQADVTDENALKALGIRNFDVAVVAVGDLQSSILISMLCKELGIKFVLAKAKDDLHSKVLYKVGVDKVIFPERDMGIRIGHNLVSSSILDIIEFSPNYSLIELGVQDDWKNKSLKELDFRKRYGINIIAIKSMSGDVNISPMADYVLSKDDILVVIGSTESLHKLEKASI